MLCEGQKESCCGAREKFRRAGPKTEAERRVENLRGPLLSLTFSLSQLAIIPTLSKANI